ncbi:MAG: hypothetical protein WCG09_09410, partial [Halobacteriota archaeon]
SLAPSQCPRHSPASFIGGRVEEDEGKLFVGGEAAREVTPPPAATAGENACHGPPSGEGKHNFYAPPRVIGFPSPPAAERVGRHRR